MSAATNFGGHSNFTLPEASSTPNGAEENQRDSTKGRSMPPLAPLERNSATDVVGNDDSMELGLDACAAMAVAMAMAIDGADGASDVGDNDNDGDGDPKISDSACADSNQSQSQSQNLYQTTKQDQNQDQKPKPKPKPSNAVDDLLTKDLMDMSVRDRASISEELHGVRSLAVDENDGDDNKNKELVTNALLDLNHALEHRIPAHKKMAFIRAQSLGQTAGTYVNDVTFRLKFLRCKLFDVNEAAWLLVNYLELTRELFGDVCLVRTIRLEDVQATKEERVAFRLGYIQLLPFGDRAGRRIVVISTDALHYSTLIRVKILLYIWTVASNDVATQRNGAILICWDGRKDMALPRPSEQQLVRKLFSAIPLRICGIHFCFPDTPFFRMARAIFTLTVVRAEHRNRLRFHVGEETELKYQVGTFGIPVTQIPITETGNIKVGSFHKWIGMRKRVEENEASETALRRQRQSQLKLQMQAHSQHQMQHQQQQHQQQHQQHQQPATNNWQIQMQMQMQVQMLPVQYTGTIGDHSIGNDVDDTNSTSKPSLFVEYPGLNDVAFRKGMSLMHHPGNDYFHGLIQSKMLEHGKSTQTGKARIAWGVVDEIRKRNGRFLSWHHQGWWAVLEDESKIRLRVAVFFREWKKHLKAEKNRQTMITSSKSAYKFQRLQGGFRRKSCDSLSSLDYSSNSTETSND